MKGGVWRPERPKLFERYYNDRVNFVTLEIELEIVKVGNFNCCKRES
jgi:hypothetical protein